jgi:aminoglycoside phosphotransferase (APT) family kinase protein
MSFSEAAMGWLAQATDTPSRELHLTELKGSTSSAVFLVQAGKARFVLRIPTNEAWLAEEPDLAEHEAAALQEAQAAGLRAPTLVAYSATDVGFGAPVVLMTFVEGRIELRPSTIEPWLDALARELATIHQHPAEGFPWHFRSWVNRASLAPPPWTRVPHLWERAIEIVLGPEPATPLVFIHRDYHPTNVLWQQGEISGVVDWINACRGPAGVDVAHCRSNLTLMFGPEVAAHFLARYREFADGFIYDPRWELDSILDMGLPEPPFYEPWELFGLPRLAPELLRQRVDHHLETVMKQF